MGTSLMQLGPDARAQAVEQIGKQEAERRAKYGNKRTEYKSIQGFRRLYDSKGEASYARVLDDAISAGLALWWIPQPTFPLPGKGRAYRGDFLVVWADGRIAIQDFKGADDKMSKLKRSQVKDLYGVDVELVRK